MTPFQIISILRKEFQSNVETSITLARAATADESEAWDKYLKGLSLAPLPADERKQRYTLNSTIHTGALPVELRGVIEHHSAAIRQKMNAYKNEFGHHDWWGTRVEKPFSKVIEEMPQQTLANYIGAVRSDSASTILQNAADGAYGYFDTAVQAGSTSHLCPACRAARQAGTDLTVCSFCGTSLF